MNVRLRVLSAAACAALACSSTPDTPAVDAGPDSPGTADASDGGGSGTLTLTPANAVLLIDSAKQPLVGATTTYSAKLGGQDVTTTTTFSMPSTFGTFTGAIMTSVTALPGLAIAATTTVDAKSAGGTGTGKLSFIRLGASGIDAQPYVLLPFGSSAPSLKAIVKLAPTFGTAKDISLTLGNAAANGAIDATKVVAGFAALGAGVPALGCAANATKDTDADTVQDLFLAVVSGAPICFEITFKDNATIPAQAAIQALSLDAVPVGQPGSVKGSAVPVYVFVPPTP